jgi:ribosome-associated toxin RatA of RatAB toxin-antitoxin module
MEQQGAHATGVLWLPAPPAAVAEILTDYEHWEELFPGRLRVVSIRREPERVVTDLHIRRFPLPGTLRLLCETHTAKDGSLVTSQLEGDFTEYRREWRLAPQARDGRPGTEGRLDLRFSLESWVPNWLLRRTLHQQLAEHFEVLYRRAQAGGAVQR